MKINRYEMPKWSATTKLERLIDCVRCLQLNDILTPTEAAKATLRIRDRFVVGPTKDNETRGM